MLFSVKVFLILTVRKQVTPTKYAYLSVSAFYHCPDGFFRLRNERGWAPI